MAKMSFFQDSIDSLFDDLNLEHQPAFCKLPAEVRNQIYEQILFNGAKQRIINIKEDGNFVQSPLLAVSQQIRWETKGYLPKTLKDPNTKFAAEVRDYKIKPLLATMDKISQHTGFSRADLAARTTLSFVGKVNLGNLSEWVQGNINDATGWPTFNFEKADIPNYVGESFFDGAISLKAHMTWYQKFEARDQVKLWNTHAREFLSVLENAGLHIMRPRQWFFESDHQMKTAVFNTFAQWHDIFLRKKEIQSRMLGQKRKKVVSDEHQDVAEAMQLFGTRLTTVAQHWPQ